MQLSYKMKSRTFFMACLGMRVVIMISTLGLNFTPPGDVPFALQQIHQRVVC